MASGGDVATGKAAHILPLLFAARRRDQPSPHRPAGEEQKCSPLRSMAPRTGMGTSGRGREGQGQKREGGGGEAVTSLTASAGSGKAPLPEPFSTARGPARCSGAIPSTSSNLSFVITSAASLLKKKKGRALKFLEQDVLRQLPFADPALKTQNVAAFGNTHEEDKLSAGLKALLAGDERWSLSLAHTHTDK